MRRDWSYQQIFNTKFTYVHSNYQMCFPALTYRTHFNLCLGLPHKYTYCIGKCPPLLCCNFMNARSSAPYASNFGSLPDSKLGKKQHNYCCSGIGSMCIMVHNSSNTINYMVLTITYTVAVNKMLYIAFQSHHGMMW